MSAEEIVKSFIRAVEKKDFARALALVTDDVEYDNVPMAAVHGHDAVRNMLGPLLAGCTEVEWVVKREAETGDIVFNERVDRFKLGDGRWLEIATAGVWEVKDGRITLWRDYFDMPTLTGQMG